MDTSSSITDISERLFFTDSSDGSGKQTSKLPSMGHKKRWPSAQLSLLPSLAIPASDRKHTMANWQFSGLRAKPIPKYTEGFPWMERPPGIRSSLNQYQSIHRY